MPKKKAKKLDLVKRFFTTVGDTTIRIGGGPARAAQRVGQVARVTKGPKAPEKADEVTQRLRELKRLETLREEELKAERKLKEEEWEERAELKRPLSERLSDVFYGLLKRPAQRLAKLFKRMDEDLYKSNIKTTPERYAALIIGVSLIVGVMTVILMSLLRAPIPLVLMGGFVAFGFALMFGRTQPKRRAKARVVEVNRVIPYAMRHMATQLSSGIGLPETMTSVSQADYGALSEEFGRVIRDMHTGMSTEEALTTMNQRVDSEPLRRAVRQVQRTLRTGGDLAGILSTLADETAFEMRMKLRDYTQSLNMLTMIYMFASAVIPALLLVMLSVGARMNGAVLTPASAAVLFLILIPFMLFYFVMMIKKFEPRL
jgi:flagellar protein FlaJ